LETNSKLEEVVGEKFEKGWLAGVSQAKIFYPKQDKRVSAEKHPLKIAIDTGRVVSSEYRVRNNHGKSRHVRVSAAPITWKNDEIVAGVAVYHDITQIREDEKRRYDFVNIASHELKTPITSLVLFSEILKKKLTTEDLADAKEIVKKMEKQTGNLQELVNNLLEASRMQSGKLTYKDEEFEMDELIREAVLALEDRERGPRIKINGLPKVRVKGDRFRIYQVLTNLIMNANKFSPKKEEVKIEMMNKQDKIQVSVKDRGSGIQKNEQKKIFDKLYQAGDPQHQTYPGMGMGLYIAKQIVRHHRGRIWVESEVGKGAKFVFEIPKGGR
jgi:PAS domain S-box-containing protein